MNRWLTIMLALLFFTISCEEESTIDFIGKDVNVIAVEAVVTNENLVHTVRLSLPYQTLNGKSKPVSGANVSISDGTNSIQLTPSDSGRYQTPVMRFVSGVTYTLRILHNGSEYVASDQSGPVESLRPLAYAVEGNGFRINFSESGDLPNYVNYQIDWSDSQACVSACRANLFYYDLKTVDTHEIFKPEKQSLVFPKGSTVVRRKYSVSDSYRSFLRSMLSETEWRGSVFDIQRDNPETNLSEGAIGFFAVSTVVSDTLKIQ